ncbi:MAG: triphosphoribosyl-dephospho-CoA synthase [Alphaproteobacteria bacterium]|nr:triphosphoribosyl-dephospho-CoA synthase [Alphaproteobacteria bacterium]
MTRFPLSTEFISQAFVTACLDELTALKPGNVHIHAAGHDMDVAHFERAARAAAPLVAQPSLSVGHNIRRAVEASMAAAGCNTNLGIILLCAPLALAAGESGRGSTLPQRLSGVLGGLDKFDAEDVFAAIAHANPGGLGEVGSGDVRAPPAMRLCDAMRLASQRDRIALAYVTGYADILEFALPLLKQAREIAKTRELAVTTLHMNLLARFPDTHVARKFGMATAEAVRDDARRRLPLCQPVATDEALGALQEFDAELKARGLNPGTTADFVVATLFTESISLQVA